MPNDTPDRQFRAAGFDLRHPQVRKFFDLWRTIQDLPRHLGQHSGGMVVCQGQLDSVVPLEPATMPGRVVVQWDKEDCADMGIVKVDLLGLGMMSVLEDSLKIIRDDYGEDGGFGENLPATIPRFTARCKKRTPSACSRSKAARRCPVCRACTQNVFTTLWCRWRSFAPADRRQNGESIFKAPAGTRGAQLFASIAWKPVLARTLGVPLFQEQLLRMAMIAAGFSGGEAEELRRAMGFKRSELRMKPSRKNCARE
jgi:error-prone DNA polymerase